MRRKKSKDQKRHFNCRMYQRYGLILSDGEYKNIVSLIRKGRATLVERQSLRIGIFDVRIRDKKYRVVYDRKRKTLVTVFPGSEE